MADKAIDSEGKVYERGHDGVYRAKMGVFGQVKETDWLGRPKVQRDIFGNPKVKKNWLGEPAKASSSPGYGGDDLATAIVGWGFKGLVMAVVGIFKLVFWGVRSLQNRGATAEASITDGSFSVPAEDALRKAADSARELGSRSLEPVHLLLGLIANPHIADAVADSGLTYEAVFQQLRTDAGPGASVRADDLLELSAASQATIDAADRASKGDSAGSTDVLHLLLVLLADPQVNQLLNSLQIQSDAVRDSLRAAG